MYVNGSVQRQTWGVVEAAPPFAPSSPALLPISASGAMRKCSSCREVGLGCASCALGQADQQIAEAGTSSFLDTWAQKLRDIANILTNASRVPQYTETGYEVTTSADSFKVWIQSPFTWVIALTLMLVIYKLRMAAK